MHKDPDFYETLQQFLRRALIEFCVQVSISGSLFKKKLKKSWKEMFLKNLLRYRNSVRNKYFVLKNKNKLEENILWKNFRYLKVKMEENSINLRIRIGHLRGCFFWMGWGEKGSGGMNKTNPDPSLCLAKIKIKSLNSNYSGI